MRTENNGHNQGWHKSPVLICILGMVWLLTACGGPAVTHAPAAPDRGPTTAQVEAVLAQYHTLIAQYGAAHLPMADAQQRYAVAQANLARNPTQTAAVMRELQADLAALSNDQAQAIPYLATNLVQTFAARVKQLQSVGENVSAYQAPLATAQERVTDIATLSDYSAFAASIQQQFDAMALPLARGQARADLATLAQLIDYCHQHQLTDYEYEGDWGLPDAQQRFDAAQSVNDYQTVDNEATMLVTNLRAMITNLSDGTPYNQPHATDLALMGYYHALQGKAIVVSLREQVLRAYDHGKLVMVIYVTTGRPELPSPPGYTTVTERLSPTVFTSDAPKGSAFYYNQTYINYALLYHDGGYFIHDAWWRLKFGPGSNLPHYDPLAFDGGSHGCVNLPLQQMSQLYAWADLGIPVILY